MTGEFNWVHNSWWISFTKVHLDLLVYLKCQFGTLANPWRWHRLLWSVGDWYWVLCVNRIPFYCSGCYVHCFIVWLFTWIVNFQPQTCSWWELPWWVLWWKGLSWFLKYVHIKSLWLSHWSTFSIEIDMHIAAICIQVCFNHIVVSIDILADTI